MATESGDENRIHHITQNSRLKTCGIRVDQEEQRTVGQYLGSQLEKREDGFFDFPDFSFGTSAIGRGIHDDGVVLVAAADFPLHELLAVIHKPADRGVAETRRCSVLLGPGNHSFGGIHMSNGSTCLGGSKGGTAGVCE